MQVFHFLLSAALLAGFIFWLWRNSDLNSSWKFVFWPALAFKLLCGIIFGLLYNGYGDTFVYQNYAVQFSDLAANNYSEYLRFLLKDEVPAAVFIEFKPYSNSFFFVKILSLLNFITGNNYYLNGLFLSLFSFAGCWYLVKTLTVVFPGSSKAAIVAFLFFPSVVFWNSGVMKEPVLLGSLCFLWALVLKTVYFPGQKPGFRQFLILFFCWLLWKIKFFLALVVYALTISWLLLKWARRRVSFLQPNRNFFGLLILLLTVTGSVTSIFLQKFADAFFFRHLVRNYETLQMQSVGKPVIELENLKPELSSVLWHTPEAIFGALFRPFIWEGSNAFYRLAGFENLFIFLLFLGCIFLFRKQHNWRFHGFYVLLLAFIIVMAALIGLTTPNLGTLNRYRTVFLPFLVFLFLQSPFWQQFFDRIGRKFSVRRD